MNRLASRNISLTLILIVVLVMVIVFRGRKPFGKDQTSFASVPDKEITRIEITGKGEKLTLEKRADLWLVNGKEEARRSAVAFIEKILTGMKIKSPVAPELFMQEITDKKLEPVRVRIYENRKMLSSFLVFKTRSNVYGNIMKKNEKSKPFIVYVPGFEGDIGSGFTVNELFWTPYSIFNLLPSEILDVTLENPAEPASSFTISGKNSIYTLSDGNSNLAGWDSSRVRRYISYFAMIPFESWALDLSTAESDRIQSSTPLYRIKVKKSDGTLTELTLWERTNPETGQKDSDRLWGKTDYRNTLFIVRYFDIDPLLKKRSYFFGQ